MTEYWVVQRLRRRRGGSSVATAMHGNGESLGRMLAGVVILLHEVSDFLETVGKLSVFCSGHPRNVLHLYWW